MSYFYNYLFYNLLLFTYWVKTKRAPEFSALMFLSFMCFIDAVSVYSYLKVRFFPEIHLETPLNGILLLATFVLGNYLYFIKNDKYLKIVEKLESESKAKKQWGTLLTICFVGITIYCFYLFGNQARDLNILKKNVL